MATWTDLTSLTDAGDPITDDLMSALRDNPVAIAEGATGAPGIQFPALESITAGTEVRWNKNTTNATSSTNYVNVGTTYVGQTGVVRIEADHRTTAGGAASDLRIQRNGVTVGTWSTTNTSFVTRSVDVTLTDLWNVITFEHRTASGAVSVEARNYRLFTNGEIIWPFGDGLYWIVP